MEAKGIAWAAFVLLLVMVGSVVAVSVQYNSQLLAPVSKSSISNLKQITSTKFIAKNPGKISSKSTGNLVKINGKNKVKVIRSGNVLTGKVTTGASLCETPGFACDYLMLPFEYGNGDTVRYVPDVTSTLILSSEPWFHLEPRNWRPSGSSDIPSSAFHTVIDRENYLYGACLTARIEFDEVTVPDFTSDGAPHIFTGEQAVEQNQNVINSCNRYEATPYAYSCAYGANPWWNSWKVLNPNHVDDAQLLSNTIAYFGQVAACDFELRITTPVQVEILDNEMGNVRFTWQTSLRSSERVEITNIDTGDVVTVNSQAFGPKNHVVTYNGLAPGEYSAIVITAITENNDFVISQSLTSPQVSFTIERIATLPELTFGGATPLNGATLPFNSGVAITVNSNEGLTSAALRWTSPSGASDFAMTRVSATQFTYSFTDLPAGSYSFSVNAVDVEGDLGASATRSFTVQERLTTPPVLTFIAPTPVNSATLPSDAAVISISSSEPLASATLHLTRPVGGQVEVELTRVSPVEFTTSLAGLRAGVNTYYVEAVDVDESETGITSTNLFTVPRPSLAFAAPTPENGASQVGASVSIAITTSEPTTTATLIWASPSETNELAMDGIDSTHYTFSLSDLAIGSHSYQVRIVDDEGDDFTSISRTLTIEETPATIPVLTFTSPTPVNGATLSSDAATISISSNESLASATLHLTRPVGGPVDIALTQTSPTVFTTSLTGLRAGINTYYITAVDVEGDAGSTVVRSFNAPLPLVSFTSLTPLNGTTLSSDAATISISSNEPLASATLYLTKPDASTTEIPLTMVSATEFTVAVDNLRAGLNSYFVNVVDDEGDGTTTSTRSFIVPAPGVSLVAPTPASGVVFAYRSSVSISIEASEPLASATLQWNNGVSTSPLAMARVDSTHFTYTFASLENALYSYSVEVLDDESDAGTSEARTLTVSPRVATPPVLTFEAPTPVNGATLPYRSSVTVLFSSNEALTSATLQWNNGASTTPLAMARVDSTHYTYTFASLENAAYSYRVNAVDVESDSGTSTTQTLTVNPRVATPPVLTFDASTPVNSAVLPFNSDVVVTVNSNEGLTSAALRWTSPSGTVNFVMTRVSATEFTYSLADLPAGSYSFIVNAVDVESDSGASVSRSFTVSPRVATPPVITFTTPTPVNGAVLSSDVATISISSSETLASATLSITDSQGTREVAMSGAGATRSVNLNGLYNGTSTYSVSAIDVEGDSGSSETRTVNVPITFLVKTFEGEAVGSMAVFNVAGVPTMFVGTWNETMGTYNCYGTWQYAVGRPHVYKSTDGENWQVAFTSESNIGCGEPGREGDWYNEMTGVYSMAVYNDGTGEALYIGTGSTITLSRAGEIWRTYDGETWERVYRFDDKKIIQLKVIYGTLYAATRSFEGYGALRWYNSTDNWYVGYVGVNRAVMSVGGYNDNIYYSDQLGALFQRGTEETGSIAGIPTAFSLLEHNSKLYAGVSTADDNSLYKTENPTTWEFENIPGGRIVWNLRELSDNHMYITISRRDMAKLWRRNGIEENELVVDYAPNDQAVDIVEFNGKKYVGVINRIAATGTNFSGYVYKLTI